MSSVVVTVIIPAFNRIEPLRYTLASVADAMAALPPRSVEVLLVDDGSQPPLSEVLPADALPEGTTILRQPNQGSIAARRHGLAAARGTYVLFVDSDDLIHPDKLRLHLPVLEATGADLSHDDVAVATLAENWRARYTPGHGTAHDDDTSRLLLTHQPLPHAPVYRRAWLARALAVPIVPAERAMDAAGDVWIYYNLAPQPGRAVKVNAALTAIGPHTQSRYSQHWERLGAAALQIAEAFVANCPRTAQTSHARRLVAQCSFESWRRLPRDYPRAYLRRHLAIWRASPRPPLSALGGRVFLTLARAVGPVAAGRLLRLRNGRYDQCRTLDRTAFHDLMNALPPAPAASIA